ncbi:DUF2357 domain-containing protein [Paenibacillus polymyxa]
MVQHSSGGNLLLRLKGEMWVTLKEAYLTEASTYEWKFVMEDMKQAFSIGFCGLPYFPNRIKEGIAYGQLTTPFYSGKVTFEINGEKHDSYIYPDSRKLTQEQYDLMLSDILEEASLCFENSNIKAGIEVDQLSRELSLAQWSYIEMSFTSLAVMIRQVMEHPTRVLQAREQSMRRDHVKSVDTKTMGWLERNRERSSSGTIPEIVRSTVREDSYNTYENKLLLRQLLELRHLLKRYGEEMQEEDVRKADFYADQIGSWLRHPLFKQVVTYNGVVQISQVFRKHPVYRQCYQWFDRLFRHGNERIGMSYNYPLRETFALYEIWCYMMLVKTFREKGLLKDSSGLFRTTRKGLFLHFAEHNESSVLLNNGMRLSYQRVFQNNSPHFYTFTQRMIPDIVIQAGDQLYILDPKYRIASNLGTALGEMHKYRDGILLCHNDERSVQTVLILTPLKNDELDYFTSGYHDRYKMGAIPLTPGGDMSLLHTWVDKIVALEVEDSPH